MREEPGPCRGDTSFLTGVDPRLSAPFLEGFNNAATTLYWVALAVVLVAFVLSLFLKTPPLRAVSAMQEVADRRRADEALLAQETAPKESA